MTSRPAYSFSASVTFRRLHGVLRLISFPSYCMVVLPHTASAVFSKISSVMAIMSLKSAYAW